MRVDLSYKISVDQIIHTGEQNGDAGWYNYGAYHMMDRRLRRERIFIAHGFILQSQLSSQRVRSAHNRRCEAGSKVT